MVSLWSSASLYKHGAFTHGFILHLQTAQSCLVEEKEEKDSGKEAPSVTARFSVITSRASPSPLSAVLPVVAV
jgi:hypothetical protein